jgi:hypothetical protein
MTTHRLQWTTGLRHGLRVRARAARAPVALAMMGFLMATPVLAAPPQIPALNWEKRSDWINVKTDVAPVAVGDGKADDTAAIQKAFDKVYDGTVLYFPPGTYRITASLSVRHPEKPIGGPWDGGLVIGHGRDTRFVWDGAAGGASGSTCHSIITVLSTRCLRIW